MSSRKQIDTLNGKLFDLKSLFFSLVQFCFRQLSRRGCLKPEDCAEDVTTNYVFERKLRRKEQGRCEILDDKILINIPNAEDQEKVLYTLILDEVRNKRSNCANCNKAKLMCPLAEELEDNDEPRTNAHIAVEPVTPEGMLIEAEYIEKIRKAIKDPVHRVAFMAHVFGGYSHREIAARLNLKASTVRKWYNREKTVLRRLFARRKDSERAETAQPRSKESLKSVKHQRESLISDMVETNRGLKDVSNIQQLKVKPLKGVR